MIVLYKEHMREYVRVARDRQSRRKYRYIEYRFLKKIISSIRYIGAKSIDISIYRSDVTVAVKTRKNRLFGG